LKSWLPVLASLAIVACRTATDSVPATPAGPAAAQARIDLTPLRGKPMNLEAFIVECQKLSGFNFTYTEATRDAMRGVTVELRADWRPTAAEFPSQLQNVVLAGAFRCKPVGPEHLHVLLIEHDAAGAASR
jgi:hypothetical protein